MKRFFITILSSALCLVSCRNLVLEDRILCPRFLVFLIENAGQFHSYDPLYVTVFNHPEGRFLDRDTTHVGAIVDQAFYFEVKGELAVRGFGLLGQDQGRLEGDSQWIIPQGRESDPLFRFSYTAPTQEEAFIVPVELVKDYAHVSLQFTGIESFVTAEGHFPFGVRVTGNTCGIEALTGQPVRGDFEYEPEEKNMGCFEFNLPRQADHTLRLELLAKPGLYDAPDQLVPFDLWALLKERGGITWEEKNLPDVELIVDYQEMSVSVNVTEWGQETLDYEF